MLKDLMELSERQVQLMAYSILLEQVLDDRLKSFLKYKGVEHLSKEIGSRYKITPATICEIN